MRKYLPIFLVLVFVFNIFNLNINSANAAFAPSKLFPFTVKSIFGTDYIKKAFPTPSQYASPIKNFAGRYFDGTESGGTNTSLGFEWYTMRASGFGGSTIKTAGNKIYMLMGNTVAAYNKDTFISRLANSANSSLAVFEGSKEPKLSSAIKYDHGILPWDAYLYPEHKDNAWAFPFIDNHTGLVAFDVDDRGHIYFIDVFGFGIARDDGSNIRIVTQIIDAAAVAVPLPTFRTDTNGTIKITDMGGYGQPSNSFDQVYTVKAGSKYYAIITGAGSGGKSGTRVIDVTDPINPQFVRSAPDDAITTLVQFGDTVAVSAGPFIGKIHGGSIDGVFKPEIRIYNAADFISGAAPKKVFSAGSAAGYIGLTVDKASGKLYSMHYSSNPRYASSAPAYISPTASISVFSPAAGTYTEKKYALSAESMGGRSSTGPAWAGYKYIYTVEALHYQNGYLVSRGLPAGNGQNALINDVKIWNFQNGVPKELDTKGFISSYYDAGKIQQAVVETIGGKDYLFISTYELADVYELGTGGVVTIAGCTAGNSALSNAGNTTFPSGEYSYCVNTSKGPMTAFYKFAPEIKGMVSNQFSLGTYLGNKFKSIIWTPRGLHGASGPFGRWDISNPWNPKDAGVVGLVTGGSRLAVGTQPAAHKGPFKGIVSESILRPSGVVFGELENGQGRVAFNFGSATTPMRDLIPVLSLAPGQGISLGQLLENRVSADSSVVDGSLTKKDGQAVIDATASGKFFLFTGGGNLGSGSNAQPRPLQIVDLTNLTGDVSFGSATLKPFSSEPWPNITELHILEVPGVKNHFLVARSGETGVTAKPTFYIGEINADTGNLIRQNSFTLDIQGDGASPKQWNRQEKAYPGSGLQSASVNGKTYVFMNEKLVFSGYYTTPTLTIAAYQFDVQALAFTRKGDMTIKDVPRILGENTGTIRFQLAKTENGDAYPMLASWAKYKESAVTGGPILFSMNLYSLKEMLDSGVPLSLTPAAADVIIPEEDVIRPMTNMGQVEVKHMHWDNSSVSGASTYNIFLKKENGKTNLYFYREASLFDGRIQGGSGGIYDTLPYTGLDAFGGKGGAVTGITGPTTLRVDKIDVSGFTGGTFTPIITDNGCTGGSVYSTTTGEPCACILNQQFKIGDRGEAVRAFQQKLKDAGFYSGKVDGIYGRISAAAALAYCKSVENPIYKTPPPPVGSTPVINTISGPTSLGVNTLGTWTASAADGNKDDLSWSVNFGEGRSVMTCKINPPAGTSQGWSYNASHSWAQAGTYTVTFYTNDCKGGSASKSITVNVSGGGGGGGSGGGGQNQTY